MTSVRASQKTEGALYEAINRGNKDTFFFGDILDKLVNPFENRYERIPPTISELRRIPPLNGAEFGRSCEFDFEIAGDIFHEPTILIDLPSWFPPIEAALNRKRACVDAVNLGPGGQPLVYGYTNGVAYFLFKKIQIYQDKLLLKEISGDALFASRATRGTLNSAYMENDLAGWHDGYYYSIAAAATPRRLRLELPFLGDLRGFPSIAMRSQSFKLRLELRTLESIVESSDPAATEAPQPWNQTFVVDGRTFKALPRNLIASPTLQLETRHTYTDGESQLALRSKPIELLYSRLYENTATFSVQDYSPVVKGVPAVISNRIDAQHPASRLLWFMRSHADLKAGRRWKFAADNSGQEFYVSQTLIIAGRDRETTFTPFVWNTLTHHAKEDRDCGPWIGEMKWDLGDIRGRIYPVERQTEGVINFTTADRPTLQTSLAAIPTMTTGPTDMTVLVDTWMLYTIEHNRGVLKYGN